MDRNVILDVKNLSTTFHTERGDYQAISGVSFQIRKGEIVGIVGESGCGKSVTSQSILAMVQDFVGRLGKKPLSILLLFCEHLLI